MKFRMRFLLATALLVGTCGNLSAQIGPPGEVFAAPPPYYAADVAALETRIDKLEKELKKKEGKVDTKKNFSVKVSGRVFVDSVNFNGPGTDWTQGAHLPPDQSNILGLREAQIGLSGEGFKIFDYKADVGFEHGPTTNNMSVRLKDAYMGAKNIPGLDYVRIGHYKIESGMSYVTSSRNSTAMERPTAVQMFSPGRRFGGGQTFYFADDRIRWFNGIFAARRMDDFKYSVDDNQGIIYNTRFTCVPYYAKDGEKFLHLGGHYIYYQNPNESGTGFTSPGSARIGGFGRASYWYTVAAADASQYNQGGFEAAWSYGPVTLSSELFAGSFDKGREIYGGYVEARWFLTGDCRPYNKKSGGFGNIKTKKNLDCVKEASRSTFYGGGVERFVAKSLGAWEMYVQWGLTDADRVYRVDNIAGGRTTDTVGGLNWYWNPNTRIMFEYVHSDGTAQGRYRATDDIFAASFRFYF